MSLATGEPPIARSLAHRATAAVANYARTFKPGETRGKRCAHEQTAREKPFDGSIGGIWAVAKTTAALTSSLRRPTRTSAPGDQEFDLSDRKCAVLPAVLGVTVLALPVAAYFWFIDRFSVNVVYVDQWSNIKLIQSWHKSGLSFGDLWAPHFDHRVLFPISSSWASLSSRIST